MLCHFLVWTLQYLKKKNFARENLKNKPQKMLIIGPKLFFSQYCMTPQTSPELIFHIVKMSKYSSVSLSVLYPYSYFILQGAFYAVVVCGIRNLRVIIGPLPLPVCQLIIVSTRMVLWYGAETDRET